jgi:hypothetical protein
MTAWRDTLARHVIGELLTISARLTYAGQREDMIVTLNDWRAESNQRRLTGRPY